MDITADGLANTMAIIWFVAVALASSVYGGSFFIDPQLGEAIRKGFLEFLTRPMTPLDLILIIVFGAGYTDFCFRLMPSKKVEELKRYWRVGTPLSFLNKP